MGTRCELRVRELGTPSSSTESYCHRLPDLHSCPHFGDLKIGGFQSKESTLGRSMIGIWEQDAKKRRVMELLLALRARKVTARARIFQAITQVKTRVQQNTLRDCSLNDARLGLMQTFKNLVSVILLRHLVIIDASLFGCRGRGCTIPSRHLIWLKLKRDPLSVTNIGLYPRFSFSVA